MDFCQKKINTDLTEEKKFFAATGLFALWTMVGTNFSKYHCHDFFIFFLKKRFRSEIIALTMTLTLLESISFKIAYYSNF